MSWNGSDTKNAGMTKGSDACAKIGMRVHGKERDLARSKCATWRGAVAGLVVVVLGAAITWVILSRRTPTIPEPIKERSGSLIKQVAPASAPKYKPPVDEGPKKPTKEEIKRRREEIMKMTPEERYQMVLERFRKIGLPDKPRTNKLFRTSLENKMAALFTTQLGDPAPVFPPRVSLHDEAFLAEILISDNPIVDSDDDRQKEKKEMVQIAKKELIKYIKEGGNPDDFLEYYQGQLQQAHKQYADARKSVFEIMRNDPAIAGEYIKKVNTVLRAKGIKEIKPPQKALDAFGVTIEDDEPPAAVKDNTNN